MLHTEHAYFFLMQFCTAATRVMERQSIVKKSSSESAGGAFLQCLLEALWKPLLLNPAEPLANPSLDQAATY